MGTRYLIDSNAIIDFFNSALPGNAMELLLSIESNISVITRIELFNKAGLSQEEIDKLSDFVHNALVFIVDERIALKTIEVRLNQKTKLPDAIIAATALEHDLILITHNTTDFNKIKGLKLIDPYNL